MDKLTPAMREEVEQRLIKLRMEMDKRTAATLTGYTTLLSELIRLLINKGIVTVDEVEEAATEVVVRGKEHGAEDGFESALVHLLAIMKNWERRQFARKSMP